MIQLLAARSLMFPTTGGLYWHPWHGQTLLAWCSSPRERVIQILESKPQVQHFDRLRLFQPVRTPAPTLLAVAMREYAKHLDSRTIYAQQFWLHTERLEAIMLAEYKRCFQWIDAVHRRECRDCKWCAQCKQLVLEGMTHVSYAHRHYQPTRLVTQKQFRLWCASPIQVPSHPGCSP